MRTLKDETFERPRDLHDTSNPAVLYARSYLLIRLIVGVIGILLPLIFIVGEAYFLQGGVQVRGSLSAYYHTAMRDTFVAGLCVIGFLLATYMAAQTDTKDFWLSLVAGVTVIGVAFFPTGRPNLAEGAPPCDGTPAPVGCAPIQQALGETAVATIHFVCAAIFILSLARICFLFARREREHTERTALARSLQACGIIILAAVAWVAVGGYFRANIWNLTPLYVGEVAAVWAFAAAWLMKGADLLAALDPRRRGARVPATSAA